MAILNSARAKKPSRVATTSATGCKMAARQIGLWSIVLEGYVCADLS